MKFRKQVLYSHVLCLLIFFILNIFHLDCVCGIVNTCKAEEDRIVNGKTSLMNEFPWQAALVPSDNPTGVFCGATIINKRQFILRVTRIIRYKRHPTRDIVYLSEKLRDMTL